MDTLKLPWWKWALQAWKHVAASTAVYILWNLSRMVMCSVLSLLNPHITGTVQSEVSLNFQNSALHVGWRQNLLFMEIIWYYICFCAVLLLFCFCFIMKSSNLVARHKQQHFSFSTFTAKFSWLEVKQPSKAEFPPSHDCVSVLYRSDFGWGSFCQWYESWGGGGNACRDLYEHWTVITRPAYLRKVWNLFV